MLGGMSGGRSQGGACWWPPRSSRCWSRHARRAAPPPQAGAGAANPRPAAPAGAHIVVVMEENHSYSEIVGAPDAPAFNRIAARGVSLTDMYATTHPSLPNYLALTSGSTQGISTDCGTCACGSANVFSQLQTAGISWKL